MRTVLPTKSLLTAAVLALACSAARADGLSDLKASLAALQGQSPLKGMVEIKSTSRDGEGKKMVESTAQANVSFEHSPRGLDVSYSKEMLAQLDNEDRAKEKDPKKKTPTQAAMNSLNTNALRQMASAAELLARQLDNATFKGEKADTFGGKPARLLSFDMPFDKLDPKEQEVVKKYDAGLEVWVSENGTPLASKLHAKKSYRMYMVISFEDATEIDAVYGQVRDHLVVLRKEVRKAGQGMGEKGESKSVSTLHVL